MSSSDMAKPSGEQAERAAEQQVPDAALYGVSFAVIHADGSIEPLAAHEVFIDCAQLKLIGSGKIAG